MLLLLGTTSPERADASGEARTLNLYNIHTKDSLSVTYKRNGQLDDAAIRQLNHFLRDWRRDEATRMDPQLFDMLWEVHREVRATGPIHVVSGYRSPNTNAMLRGRSRGVARTSLHMQGKAVDFSIPSANVADVRAAALRVQGGGVGYYPSSGVPFVHMDVGNVRHWPRMTRDQLARVFPDGRTLHMPTDGKPMPGYQLALADRGRGARPASAPSQPRSLLAALTGGGRQQEHGVVDGADTVAPQATATPVAMPAPRPAQPAAAAVQVAMADIPMPLSRPSAAAAVQPRPATFQVASAASIPVPAPVPQAPAARSAPLSPNQVIADRGFWEELTEKAQQTGQAGPALAAAAGRETTASLGLLARNDRVPPDVALSYAAEGEARPVRGWSPMGRAAHAAPARVTTTGSASVAQKPTRTAAVRPAGDVRLNDPWLRGVVMAKGMDRAMTATMMDTPDMRALEPFMEAPGSAVLMTFSADPHLGLSAGAFTGSAVVFPATVTFRTRTAALRR